MKLKKPHFNNFSEDISGPYYDPYDSHLHNWKNPSLIKNFTGEQFPIFEEYSINTNIIVKNGEYCCICHKRKGGLVTNPICNKITTNKYYEALVNIQPVGEILNTPIAKDNIYVNDTYKDEKFVIYKLNSNESLYIRYSDMTYYQKFKYMNPNYKSEISFIINTNKFNKNYYIIVIS